MKKSLAYLLIFLFSVLMLLPLVGKSQATFTAPVGYNTGAPTATPSGVGTRWRIDLLTGKKYTWLPGTLSWDEDARGIDQVAGCSAPLYTPGYNQSTFAVNACSPPVLYQWTGAAWDCLNCTGYIAGTGIDITGGVITNTAPNIVQELSISGQDLTLSGGGGTVAIPGGDNIYTADGTLQATRTIEFGGNQLLFRGGVFDYLFEDGDYTNGLVLNAGETAFSVDDGSTRQISSFAANPNQLEFLHKGADRKETRLIFNDNGAEIESAIVGFLGLKYNIFYPDIETNPQSITDVQTVNSLKQKLATYTESERDAISSPATGYIIYNTNATATDGSTGVMQVWNGSAWKNAW